MVFCMVFHGMTKAHDFSDQFRMPASVCTDAKESRFHTGFLKYRKDPRRDFRVGPIINRQSDARRAAVLPRQSRVVGAQQLRARPKTLRNQKEMIEQDGAQAPEPGIWREDNHSESTRVERDRCTKEQR